MAVELVCGRRGRRRGAVLRRQDERVFGEPLTHASGDGDRLLPWLDAGRGLDVWAGGVAVAGGGRGDDGDRDSGAVTMETRFIRTSLGCTFCRIAASERLH